MDNTYFIREIRRTYSEYVEETDRLEKDRKVNEGLLGFGKGPGTHPCHDRFSERVEQLLTMLAEKAPASAEVYEVLEFMYDAPLKNKNNALAFWMMQAVHSLTERLIGFLTPEDADSLLGQYTESYPKSARLPAQKKIAAQLASQAGEKARVKKRNLLDIIRGRE